jgi:hypothetical protein
MDIEPRKQALRFVDAKVVEPLGCKLSAGAESIAL